ncbi:MAG: hypothetical protein AUJ21_11935 [Anaerolineae bacterium CG1_02_58_13]|nr:MAG: hypothetical protein AUJ21_11935 [Anaerolineae bacterium CG1_02_58_13]
MAKSARKTRLKTAFCQKPDNNEIVVSGMNQAARDTTEKVRLIVHGKRKPIKSVQMDVFAYA